MELIKNNISFYDLTMDKRSSYEETADMVVPDTYPDVLRIICAEGNVIIKEKVLQNDRILVSGVIKTKVLYMPEDEKEIKILYVPISFSHIEELSDNCALSEIFVNGKSIKITARLLNSRKISVNVNMLLTTKCYTPGDICVTEQIKCEEIPLELLRKTHIITLPSIVKRKSFTIFEEIDFSNNNVSEIINSKSVIKLSDKKIMSNKIMLRGEICVSSLVLTTENVLKKLNYRLNFNQIFEVDGLSDDMNIHAELFADGTEFELSGGIFSLGITVDCAIRAYKTYEIQEICDLYNPKYDIKTATENIDFNINLLNEHIHKEHSEIIPTGMKIMNIISSDAILDNIISCDADIIANIICNVLYVTDDMEVYEITRILQIKMENSTGVKDFIVKDIIPEVNASIIGEDSINIKALVDFDKYDIAKKRIMDICQIELSHEKVRNPKLAMLLKYVHEPISVWEIAKANNTCMSAIYEANDIPQEQTMIESQMIIIPIK